MLCSSCGKNEANIHYTKVINGKYEEDHLCEECALKNVDFEKTFSTNKLFAGFIEGFKDIEKEKKDDIKCKFCGLDYSGFVKDGKFGCVNCYEEFREKLDPLIKGLHGNNTHRGKIPLHASDNIHLQREEDNLELELENAIKMEEFERAAEIRDELRRLRMDLEKFKIGGEGHD